MGRSPIYQGRIVDLGLEDVVLPNGARVQLEVIRHRGAAAIVPLHDDRTVTLVHQFRHAAGGMIWEVPAGVLDGGEAPETCAARELREEVQLAARTLTRLGSILTTPGFTDERIHSSWPRADGRRGTPEADSTSRWFGCCSIRPWRDRERPAVERLVVLAEKARR
jgi:ADP-ribose pyrophosphatase